MDIYEPFDRRYSSMSVRTADETQVSRISGVVCVRRRAQLDPAVRIVRLATDERATPFLVEWTRVVKYCISHFVSQAMALAEAFAVPR
jgi:hypothetical protein